MNDSLIKTALFTALWCLGHSVPITHTVRDRMRNLFPRYHIFDRAVFVIYSTMTLVILLAWLRTQPQNMLWDWPGWWSVVRWVGLLEAVVLFWLGSRSYSGSSFLGLNQIRDFAAGRPATDPELCTTGILGIIRHPWYTGTLIFLTFCLPVTDVNLTWRAVMVLYVLVGSELEERKLLRDLGDSYAEYRRRVPRFFPSPFKRP